jgi:hypothetical protein
MHRIEENLGQYFGKVKDKFEKRKEAMTTEYATSQSVLPRLLEIRETV